MLVKCRSAGLQCGASTADVRCHQAVYNDRRVSQTAQSECESDVYIAVVRWRSRLAELQRSTVM